MALGDSVKADQIAFHIYTKLFHVLYAARASEQAPGPGQGKTDKWFNLETPLAPPSSTPTLELDAFRALSASPPPPQRALAVQILLVVPPPGGGTALVHKASGTRLEPEPRFVLLEEWVLAFTASSASSISTSGASTSSASTSSSASDTATSRSSSTDDESSADVLPPTIYKNAIPLFRALYALLRILPAWRVVRKLTSRRAPLGAGGGPQGKRGLRVVVRLRPESSEGMRMGGNEETTLSFGESPAPEAGAPPLPTSTHVFPGIQHPAGTLTLSATYLMTPAFSLESLEALLSSRFAVLDARPGPREREGGYGYDPVSPARADAGGSRSGRREPSGDYNYGTTTNPSGRTRTTSTGGYTVHQQEDDEDAEFVPTLARRSITTEVGMLNRNGTPGNAKTETLVIYSPHGDRPEPPVDSFTTNDLTCIQTHLSIGGCLMSIYEPTEAALWIEDNWDNPLLTSFRNSGCGGPFAWMLSPTKPALVIFGSYNEPVVVNMAQTLAHSSRFPVVIRPDSDNPAFTLLAHDTDTQNGHVRFNNTSGNNDEGRRDLDDQDEAMTEDEHTQGETGNGGRRDDDPDDPEPNEHALNTEEHKPHRDSAAQAPDGGDGGGGGGEPTMVDGKWESPLHRTDVKLRLKLNTAHTYKVNIGYSFKFIIFRDTQIPFDLEDLTRPLSRPEVIALVDLKIINIPHETQVDRSYASIGFVAHRKKSIIDPEFLHRGFDLPDQTYKHGQQRQIQRGIQAAVGFSQGPMGTATLSYNRNNTTTLEATDNKVMPKCRVVPEMGDEWNEGPKSYSSYNIAYQLRDMRLDAERSESHSMKIRVGMGINLRPAGSKKPLPQISFVNRNQVLIWVSDPTSKAQIRGIMVLMSSYLDNIRTEDELSIFEEEEIELGTGCLKVPKIKTEEEEPGTIALSIAQVEKQPGTGTNKLRAVVPSFITKFGQRPSVSPPTDISPHEYLARGWDANNNEWRRVLWPALDKDFRPADPGTAPVWKLQCPWTKGPATIGTN